MRFYVVALSVYGIVATALILLLSIENNKLKKGPGGVPPQIDYDTVRTIPLSDAPRLGPESAPITVVLFSDYECPFCAKGSEVVTTLMEEYKGKIQLAMKHFPLRSHPNARSAAAAALAAQKQGKFWEMHEILHGLQNSLGHDAYLSAAETIGLDMNRFTTDMHLENWEDRIQEDLDLGMELKVYGTPTVFVNGVWVPPSYDFMKQAVDHLLKKDSILN